MSAWDSFAAQQDREAKTTTGDYLHSIVRQDSPVDGIVAAAVGAQFKPDPNFTPYDQKWYEEMGKGLPEDLKPALLQAVSQDHATYIRERLDDKVSDLQHLGDMGVAGNAARFLLGLVEPTNLALGLVSGGVATAAKGLGMAGRVGLGLGAGFAQGYGFERLRQAYNYENSQPDAVWAGLMGTAFSAPFVGLHAAEMARVRQIAADELERQRALRPDMQDTVDPAAAQSAQERLAALDEQAAKTFTADPAEWENSHAQAELDAANKKNAEYDAIWQAGNATLEGDAVEQAAHNKTVADQRAERLAGAAARLKRAREAQSIKTAPAEASAPAGGTAAQGEELTAMGLAFKQAEAKRNAEIASLIQENTRGEAPTSEAPAAEAPPAAPSAPEPIVGKGVFGATPDGAPIAGKVMRVAADGHLLVKDDVTERIAKVNPEHLDPESPGYREPAVDGFIPEGSIGGGQRQRVAMEKTALSSLRFDIYAYLNRSKNAVVQHLGNLFVKDAIGAVDAEGNQIAQRRSASEDKKLLQRTVGGGFHYDAAQAYDSVAKKLGYNVIQKNFPSNVKDFYENVGRYMRDPASFAQSPIREELERAANAHRKAMSTMLDEMQKAGVKGSETLAQNPDYLHRIWNQQRIFELRKQHGPEAVRALIANAIRDKDPIIARFRDKHPNDPITDREILEKSAQKFIDSVMALEHSHLSQELLMTATDAPTLRSELLRAKLSPAEAESIIDHLFEVREATGGDTGRPAELKYRFNLDEGASHQTESGDTLHLHDLLENDVRLLVDRYMNTMSGHIAMARRGIKSRADFEAMLREADQYHSENNTTEVTGKQYDEEKQVVRDMYDHIVGRPMSVQSFNKGDRVASAFRAYARSTFLGQLGFTAMLEVFHAASLMGFRAAFEQMPSLREFYRAAKGGQIPADSLAQDVRQMLGYLNEHVSAYARQSEITEHTYDKGLGRWENAGNTLSHAVDHFSGNSMATSVTRGMAAAGFIQKYANLARGRGSLTKSLTNRLIGSGVREADIPKMLEMLKEHATFDGNRVTGVDWEGWSAKDPYSYHDFTTAVDRDTRQAIQDHDIGETWLFQHTAIGKVFTELRAFNIAAHSKQMLNAVHYKDRMSLMLFTNSLIANGMAYIVQTAMNFGHDQAEMDKRLTMARIAQAAYQRANMMGITPFITNTLWPGFLTPSAFSQNALTANTQSRNALMPPSFNLLSNAVTFMGTGNLRDGLSLIPGSNTYGARNLVDMIGKYQNPPKQ